MDDLWEVELARLLAELSESQSELLDVLARKRECLAATDLDGLRVVQEREEVLIVRLQRCSQQRLELLERARVEGLPGDSIGALVKRAPASQREQLAMQVEQARRQSRLVQQRNLTNWVLAQRSLIHWSQLLEIIAT